MSLTSFGENNHQTKASTWLLQNIIPLWYFIVLPPGQTERSLHHSEASSLLPPRRPKCSLLPSWCSSARHRGPGGKLLCNLGRIQGCLSTGHRPETGLDLSGTKGTIYDLFKRGTVWEKLHFVQITNDAFTFNSLIHTSDSFWLHESPTVQFFSLL